MNRRTTAVGKLYIEEEHLYETMTGLVGQFGFKVLLVGVWAIVLLLSQSVWSAVLLSRVKDAESVSGSVG